MNTIQIHENKTLKLQNILGRKFDMKEINQKDCNQEVEKMQTFIKIRGAKQIGPLIQYSEIKINENNELDINMQFMLQADHFIHDVEAPYHMETILKVKNCLYARYKGPEDKIKFAYDKLGVYAFENDIELNGSNYTIYVDRNEEEESIIADVFMLIKE